MHSPTLLRAGLRPYGFAFLVFLAATAAFAQNLTFTVVPGGTIDIPNNTGNRWYITAPANMSGATISRLDANLIAEDVWPNSPNFYPDTTSYTGNRIWSGQYLRVYANSLPVNTVITIPYNTPNPTTNSYTIKVTVKTAPAVTGITLLDANPTAAASVRWQVSFSEAISGVTAANFALTTPNGLSGATITGVSGSGSTWTVTASTGTGLGLLGCNWVGHKTESPSVPNTFTGFQYSFQASPVITADPASAYIATNATQVLSVGATLRGGGSMSYQWYVGPYASRSAISGATGASYTVPASASVGLRQYSCRVFNASNTSYYTDTALADINTVGPVQITTQPAGAVANSGRTATLTVAASGTAPLRYQWYRGAAGDTSAPVGTSASYTTDTLSANTTYWVRVGNNLPASYDKNSSAATVRVVASLTGNGPLSTTVGTGFATAPAFTARDSAGAVVAGITVTFSVPATGATARWNGQSTASVATNASGLAQTGALTATTTSGFYSITGSFGSVTATIAATNLAGAPTSLVALAGNSQTTFPGTGFATSLQAKLTDTYGNPVPGRTVTFSAPASGASATFVPGATATTDTTGVVSVAATANLISGAYQASANISPALASPAVFSLANYTRLDNWRLAHFGSTANSGAGADTATPFGDGVANLLKFAFNMNADGPDASVMTETGTAGLPLVSTTADGRLTVTFVRRPAGTSAGVTYAVQFSDDLATWAANPSATTGVPVSLGAEFERVVVTDSVVPTSAARRFVRALVTNP